MEDDSQFDALLGGREELPASLTLAKFVACRSQEIQIMKNAMISQSGSKLAFQTLPNHMRRRAMSHNAKRLPRRLRQIHLNQMKKSGMPAKQKRPSRKYRRRPRNLTEEYTRRANKKYKWLQTHIWHAKRFHMVEKWGYKLPNHPCDKAFRACYRAMSQHCLLQDISYFNCIEISGDKDLIIESIKQMCRCDGGLSIGAKVFINGKREGELNLYDVGGRAFGNVIFQWQPQCDNVSKLWLWIHAAFYDNVKKTLINIFNIKHNIALQELGVELSRFRLTGPLSNSVLHNALEQVDVDKINISQSYLKEYIASPKNKEVMMNQCKYWNEINDTMSTSELPPHVIVPLIVKDPRMNLPKKRTKSVPGFKQCTVFDVPNDISESPLWQAEIRKEMNENKLSDSEIANLQGKLLVPGSTLQDNAALIPIILIQRPGNRNENIGFGGGWDIILPSIWSKPFWIALVMRGARVGGLREYNSMLFEMGKSQFLRPDTKAGMDEQHHITKHYIEHFFRKPPNKRINFNKFKIASPYSYKWKLLLQDWNSTATATDFTVIKDKRVLHLIDIFLNSKSECLPDYPKYCLIPVKLECEKKGCPSQFSIICIPKSRNDFKGIVMEPSCEDEFQQKRKELRQAHQSLLKKLRKQRKANSKLNLNNHKEILISYTRKIRELWLPEPSTIRNSCSREVIGYVTKGGFSFSMGKSCATGYITSDALPALMDFRNRILFRNTNTRQYRVAKLTVIVE